LWSYCFRHTSKMF